jgi:hypothetical protein
VHFAAAVSLFRASRCPSAVTHTTKLSPPATFPEVSFTRAEGQQDGWLYCLLTRDNRAFASGALGGALDRAPLATGWSSKRRRKSLTSWPIPFVLGPRAPQRQPSVAVINPTLIGALSAISVPFYRRREYEGFLNWTDSTR